MVLPTDRDLSRPLPSVELRVRRKEPIRLDQYLLRALGWRSRTKIQKLIASGRVSVNELSVKPAMRVSEGDHIVVQLNVGGEAVLPGQTPLPPPFWEDPYLLAVNKPPGRLVHPVGKAVGGTVINELHHRYRPVNETGLRPVVPKLCHRLDRDTSGVLLIAKTDHARASLQASFDRSEIAKEYLAVVAGAFREPQTIDLPILVSLDRSKRTGNRLAQVDPKGKPSRTIVEPIVITDGFSLVRCRPITGRQNQIRAHLAGVGHPIAGDLGYGSCADTWAETVSIPFPERPLLHSASFNFPHPVWRTRHQLVAPPPPDFTPFLADSVTE